MRRRRFIGTAAGAAAAVAAMPESFGIESPEVIVDSNVFLGRWPFRRLPVNTVSEIAAVLRGTGAGAALAGSFEALLHRDLDSVNERLATACEGESAFFDAMGAVNPRLPGWRETLRRCREDFAMPGIRLHPNYHGYGLDDPAVAELLRMAEKRGMLVQIAVRMEDTRTQHPKAAVPDVKVQPLLDSLEKAPGVKVQLLNAMRTVRDPLLLARLGKFGVGAEIAMLEGIEGIRNFLDRESGVQLCYGSYTPFFYAESARLKLEESVFSGAERMELLVGNMRNLMGS